VLLETFRQIDTNNIDEFLMGDRQENADLQR